MSTTATAIQQSGVPGQVSRYLYRSCNRIYEMPLDLFNQRMEGVPDFHGKPLAQRKAQAWNFRNDTLLFSSGMYGCGCHIKFYNLLVPPESFTGQRFESWNDEKAIADGSRERGDMNGVSVMVKGREFIISGQIAVYATAPRDRGTLAVDQVKQWLFDDDKLRYPYNRVPQEGYKPVLQQCKHFVTLHFEHPTEGRETNNFYYVFFFDHKKAIIESTLSCEIVEAFVKYQSPCLADESGQMSLF